MPRSPVQRLFGELKRRKVFRAAGAYFVIGWVVIEVAGTVAPMMGLPAWVPRLVLLLVLLGFPIAVALAWAMDITDEGLRRTDGDSETGTRERHSPSQVNRAAATVLGGSAVVAAALAGAWYLTGAGGPSEELDRSVAVLPFETLGSQAPSAFTEGVHSGILTRLASVSDVDVTSRTSVIRYRSTEASLPQIAKELGVAWAVRGEVQELDGQVLVNARLLNARADRQVWADAYRRELTAENVFRIQSEIATAVLSELQARLTAGEEQRVEREPTKSLEAYLLYVQGRTHLDARTETGIRQSLSYFRGAIERDSSYALAWVGLADALSLLHDYGYDPSPSTLARAEEAVIRALDLDPSSAEAHASLGLLAGAGKQAQVAIQELQRAVELRPSYAEAHNWLAWFNLAEGNEEAALQRALRAVELDPLAPEALANLALSYLAHGRYADALRQARRVTELQPELPDGRLYEAQALYEMGRAGEAKPLLRGLIVPWTGSGPAVTLAAAETATGDVDAALRLMAEFEAAADEFGVGVVRAALGDVDGAFAAFDQVRDWSDYWPTMAVQHLYADVLGPLRADPRYVQIRARLERAWNTGSQVIPLTRDTDRRVVSTGSGVPPAGTR